MTLRNTTLPERIEVAAQAGFSGIGWRLEDFEAAESAGSNERHILRLLESAGVQAVEVEFFREWVGLERDSVYQGREHELLRLAGNLGSRYLNVAVYERESRGEVVEAMAGLCHRAAEYHLVVQLEFMPYDPAVPSLEKAWEIVRSVRLPNAGLLLDAWHWARSYGPEAALAEIPAGRITGIQLCDALPKPQPDLAAESRHHRLLPGEGSVNFLRVLARHGVSCPVSVEVMSDDLDELPPLEAADQAANDARTVLQKATWQSQTA
jgi:sugar phosphate isomerase/epimerase